MYYQSLYNRFLLSLRFVMHLFPVWLSYDWAMVLTCRAYRVLYIINWIYRYFTEDHFTRWIGNQHFHEKKITKLHSTDLFSLLPMFRHICNFPACVSGLIQTALFVDFFYVLLLLKVNNWTSLKTLLTLYSH